MGKLSLEVGCPIWFWVLNCWTLISSYLMHQNVTPRWTIHKLFYIEIDETTRFNLANVCDRKCFWHLESSPTTIEKAILCCSAKGHLCQGTSFSDIPDITDIAKASFQRHETHLGDFEIMITGFIYVECSPKWDQLYISGWLKRPKLLTSMPPNVCDRKSEHWQ
jgi:hypothetical protein